MTDDQDILKLVEALNKLKIPILAKEIKNFWFDGKKYRRYQWDRIDNDFRDALDDWEKAVKNAVSDKLPLNLVGKARPAERTYPFSVSGDLLDSVSTGVRLNVTNKNNRSIRGWAEITSPHAAATNAGFSRPRADGASPNWIGWRDRVFTKGDTKFNIISVSDIFNAIAKERRSERDFRGL